MISEKAKKLGEALVSAKVLTREQLDGAIANAIATGSSSLTVALLKADFLTFAVFEKFLASSLGIKSMIIGERRVGPKVLELLKKETIENKYIFPVEARMIGTQNYLILGMVDPLDTDAITLAKAESHCAVTPCLISLPDFTRTVKRHFADVPIGTSVALNKPTGTDENMVLIRPGGYEEEIAAQQALQEATNLKKDVQEKNSIRDIDLETGFSSSRHPENKVSIYLGSNATRLKEEILAKLDLQTSDARRFRHPTYSRESLFKELPEVSLQPLVKLFETLSPEIKIEAVINALIEKNLLAKRDIYHSAAISFIFEDKK